MSDLPKFIAKSEIISNLPEVSGISVPNIPAFDLDRLNLVELCGQLKARLNEPTPTFIFSSERRNRKLELERERVQSIFLIIEGLRDVNASLAKARAEILLSKDVSESIIHNYFTDKILLAELKSVEHKNNLSKVEDEMTAREIQLESGNLANLKVKAEINMMEAHTKEAHAKADLVKYVVENIDLKNMPPLLQSFVVQSIINPHGQGNVTDMELQGELKQYIKQEKQAAADKQTQEVRIIKTEAEMKEMDTERNRQAMEEERQKRTEKIKK